MAENRKGCGGGRRVGAGRKSKLEKLAESTQELFAGDANFPKTARTDWDPLELLHAIMCWQMSQNQLIPAAATATSMLPYTHSRLTSSTIEHTIERKPDETMTLDELLEIVQSGVPRLIDRPDAKLIDVDDGSEPSFDD